MFVVETDAFTFEEIVDGLGDARQCGAFIVVDCDDSASAEARPDKG